MDPESGSRPLDCPSLKAYRTTLLLAYQSFGVVYGDLTISPIYVYKSTFSGKLRLHEEDVEVLGVFSLVFWTLTLIALCKYIIIVLGADDNGEGGTFALYSLMCRNSKLGLMNAHHDAHEHLSAYKLEAPSKETSTSLLIKNFFEKHRSSRIILFLVVLLGISMVVGDGVLTPAISVLSAVSGLRVKIPELHENYTVFIACIIIMALFALQHYGTHRVGFLFAPVLIVWLGCISGVGIYNIIKWNPGVIRALSPYYIYSFLNKAGKDGWSSLGGIVLCITGSEAMFADLGHFSKLSIRMAFTGVVYPCLVLAYMGEAAYLSKNKEDLQRSFYKAIPECIFWPVFVIATLASVVGSQAIISATFSLISQCRAFGCFPRVKIIHTSGLVHGQIYIPEVNWLLMVLCLAVTIVFRDTNVIGNAYGLSVITVMSVTTCLMFLIITTVWNQSFLLALLFLFAFAPLEFLYLSASLSKLPHGGYLPFLLSLITLITMTSWHYGTSQKLAFELHNKVNLEHLLSLLSLTTVFRVPGVALVYSSIPAGIPHVFAHFVTNFPAFHRFLIFVTIQTWTVPKIPQEERFIISRIGPKEHRMFRCIVNYGYKDGGRDSYDFENRLMDKVAEFCGARKGVGAGKKRVRFEGVGTEENEEVRELGEEREAGVAYVMGNTRVVARENSTWVKKVAIDAVYGFLRRNSRKSAVALGVPHESLIEVGMVYQV